MQRLATLMLQRKRHSRREACVCAPVTLLGSEPSQSLPCNLWLTKVALLLGRGHGLVCAGMGVFACVRAVVAGGRAQAELAAAKAENEKLKVQTPWRPCSCLRIVCASWRELSTGLQLSAWAWVCRPWSVTVWRTVSVVTIQVRSHDEV